MSVRNPGRYAAPIAIVAVLIAVVLIVRARTNSHPSAPPARVTTHQLPLLSREAPKAAFYVVKPGDSLSVISVKTHVPVATLEALNPSLANPDTLQAGERLRLR